MTDPFRTSLPPPSPRAAHRAVHAALCSVREPSWPSLVTAWIYSTAALRGAALRNAFKLLISCNVEKIRLSTYRYTPCRPAAQTTSPLTPSPPLPPTLAPSRSAPTTLQRHGALEVCASADIVLGNDLFGRPKKVLTLDASLGINMCSRYTGQEDPPVPSPSPPSRSSNSTITARVLLRPHCGCWARTAAYAFESVLPHPPIIKATVAALL